MQARESFPQEIAEGRRFEFGKNWSKFLANNTALRVDRAIDAIQSRLMLQSLAGIRFLDAGSGSGLFSLAARRLGARVVSFDFDPASVACTQELKRREGANDDDWRVLSGSVLDRVFLESLGQFDVVYSWGVLHHTGAMWEALENVRERVRTRGRLCIAIYNDQGRASGTWLRVKRLYNRLPHGLRWCVTVPCFVRLWMPTMLRDTIHGRFMHTWRSYSNDRGMSPWRDVVDWVGGLPFEVATPEAIFDYFDKSGYRLAFLKTCAGGIGCNEYTFLREAA